MSQQIHSKLTDFQCERKRIGVERASYHGISGFASTSTSAPFRCHSPDSNLRDRAYRKLSTPPPSRPLPTVAFRFAIAVNASIVSMVAQFLVKSCGSLTVTMHCRVEKVAVELRVLDMRRLDNEMLSTWVP